MYMFEIEFKNLTNLVSPHRHHRSQLPRHHTRPQTHNTLIREHAEPENKVICAPPQMQRQRLSTTAQSKRSRGVDCGAKRYGCGKDRSGCCWWIRKSVPSTRIRV